MVDGEAERAVRKLPRGAGRLLYRGPILSAEEYEMLYEAVEERGAELVVDPIAYEHALYVPEHHDAIADLAAPTRWTHGADVDEAHEAALELGDPPWLLKDHVKSAKDRWEDACFVPAGATRDELARIRRGARGGARRSLRAGLRDPEVPRSADEQRANAGAAHPGGAPPVLLGRRARVPRALPRHRRPLGRRRVAPFAVLGERITSPFFTADVAFLSDGGWIVVEINDGGVSVIPEQLDPRELYQAVRR